MYVAHNERDQENMTEPLADLVERSRKRFGVLLRNVCEIGGVTQGMLSREAKRELRRLREMGEIVLDESVGSLEQPTISKVMAGMQAPTYYQVSIWVKVLQASFTSDRLAMLCQALDISQPAFDPTWEQALWRLAHFVPPQELCQVYECAKDLKVRKMYQTLSEHKEIPMQTHVEAIRK